MDRKKFEVPMRDVVNKPLNEHKCLSLKLCEAIYTASKPPNNLSGNVLHSVEELFEEIITKDKQLLLAVKLLSAHQKAEQTVQSLKKQVQLKDQLVLNYARKLRQTEQKLGNLLKKHKAVIANCKETPSVRLHPSDVVAYAHRIAGTTSAPPTWKPGLPMFGFTPPAPLAHMMRSGVLSRGFVDEIVTADTEKDRYQSTAKSSDGANQDIQVPLGVSVAASDISKLMPVGWKPGDPIELPKDVIYPRINEEFMKEHKIEGAENWKLGDPIPPGSIGQIQEILGNSKRNINGKVSDDESPEAKKRRLEDSESDDDSSDDDSSDSEKDAAKTISLSLSSDEDSD